jgi:hypothetical protein
MEAIMEEQIHQEMSFSLRNTRSGHITCQVTIGKQNVLLHSAYDPVKEARQLVANHIDKISIKERIIIYGLGCGHHIAELVNVTKGSKIKIEVWEFNTALYEFIKAENIVDNVLMDSRVSIYVSHNKKEIVEKALHFNLETDYIIMHQASVKLIPEWLKDIKESFEIFQLNISNMLVAKDKLNEHFAMNIKTAKIDRYNLFFNLLDNIPMVLVAAGPSLQKNINFLKQYNNQVFIGAVGTALQLLVDKGIIPDFFMLTDSKEAMFLQFAQVPDSLQKTIPLFYLSTVMPSVVLQYGGPKIMLLQQGLEQAEKLANELKTIAVQTGGSVATTLLDWMVQLGAKQICFVGQDLAYSNNETYVPGILCHTKLSDDSLKALKEVDDYFRKGKVRAPGSLYIYKKWIETYVWQHADIKFFNATQGGAYIEGCEHVNFEGFIKKIFFTGDIRLCKEKFQQVVKRVSEN